MIWMHLRLHPCRRICCVQVPEDFCHVCSVHMCVYSDPRKHSWRESRARVCCPKYCTADEPSFCRRSVTFGLTTMPLRQLDPSMRMCRLFAIQATRSAWVHSSTRPLLWHLPLCKAAMMKGLFLDISIYSWLSISQKRTWFESLFWAAAP